MARKYLQGKFKPKNPSKYEGDFNEIIYRSSWEKKLFIWCDTNKNILSWSSEEIIVPYYSPVDGKVHRYFVDCKIRVKQRDGSIRTYLVEIKPDHQTKPPVLKKHQKKSTQLNEIITWETNKAKWTAAIEYANKRGWEFKILTEHHLF